MSSGRPNAKRKLSFSPRTSPSKQMRASTSPPVSPRAARQSPVGFVDPEFQIVTTSPKRTEKAPAKKAKKATMKKTGRPGAKGKAPVLPKKAPRVKKIGTGEKRKYDPIKPFSMTDMATVLGIAVTMKQGNATLVKVENSD